MPFGKSLKAVIANYLMKKDVRLDMKTL